MRIPYWLKACLPIGIASMVLAGYQTYRLIESRHALVRNTKETAQQQAARAANEIDHILRQTAVAVESLANDLRSGVLTEDNLDERLKATIEEEKEILTVGVAYDTSFLGRLHAPAFTRHGEPPQALQLEDHLDYTDAEVPWYREANEDGRGWRNPSWSEAEETMTVVYSAPFRRKGTGELSAPAGVAFASLSLDRISERVDELETGQLGWGGVLSEEGRYLVHPNEQRIEDPSTLLEVLHARGDDELLAVIKKALSGESVSLERTDTTTGQTGWFFHEPVKTVGWSVVLSRFENEVLVSGRPYRRRVIMIAVVSIVGLMCIAGWAAGTLYSRRPKTVILWALVGFTSLLMLGGMQLIRIVTFDQVSDEDRATVKIFDEDSLSSFVKSQEALWESRSEIPPVTVPTGILVRTVAFQEAKELFVTGVLWQKFTDDSHRAIPQGVDFPDAVQHEFTEAYRHRRGPVETVGWRFDATLRQIMDLSRYPLDHDNVAIRLLPKDYDSRVVLVPDLASYTMANPTAKPGLEETLELSGWSIVGSFFDFKYSNYNADLGIPDYEGEESIPELHFNIELKRNILNAVIANGIPIVIVLLMLFAIIVKKTDDVDESKLFGFNPSGVMRICSALFFVVLLAHIQLRSSLEIEDIVLLEYLYFTVYLAILFTALHTFLYFSKSNMPIIKYKESLIIKLLFWPTILGLQLLITIVVFY